jgi:hypothetical protein
MRKILFITFTLLTIIFGCKKSESTSPTPQVPKYSIRAGDKWVFQVNNSNDSLVLIAKSETTLTINNKSIKFYPIADLTNTPMIYVNASDSILFVFPLSNHLIFSRLVRANVKTGDSWEDTTYIAQDTFAVVKTRVDSVNASESVPAGSYSNVIKINQDYYGVIHNVPFPFANFKFSIKEDVIFVRMKVSFSGDTTDLKLKSYQKASQ